MVTGPGFGPDWADKVVTDVRQLSGGLDLTEEERQAWERDLAACRGRGGIGTFTADDIRRYGALLHSAAHGVEDQPFCREQMCRQFARYAEVLLAALAQDGRLLPAGTEARIEHGSRVLIGDEVVGEVPTSLEQATATVDYHADQRRQDAGWRGSAVVLRRTHHTTPWVETDPTLRGTPA